MQHVFHPAVYNLQFAIKNASTWRGIFFALKGQILPVWGWVGHRALPVAG